MMIAGGLIISNKNHPNVKPHWDKIEQFFGMKPKLTQESEAMKVLKKNRETLDKMSEETQKLLKGMEASKERLNLAIKVVDGDYQAWVRLKPLLEKQTPDAIEPLLKANAIKGHTSFIKELTGFYLERAGIISKQSREIKVASNETENMHLYEPAYIWLRVLEDIDKIDVPTSMQEIELTIKMRYGTEEWDKLKASLNTEAQALASEINENIKTRLEANISNN